jgi:non-canonical (house-cleaning) NTP pyrophosphatase
MKILLGSNSESKLNILKDYFGDKNVEIIPISVVSEIVEQPLDLKATINGSINRARNAIINYKKNFDYSIGMEAGLDKRNDIFNLICVVTSIDKNSNVLTTYSDPLPLPDEVSKRVNQGHEFGVVIREYSKKENNDKIQELIKRKDSFKKALKLQKL